MTLEDFKRVADIVWDKANKQIYKTIMAKSGDSAGRRMRVQVVNAGLIEDLTGCALNLGWKTKDGVHKGLDAFTVIDITHGLFEITYTTGMLSNVGKLDATLQLVDTVGVIESDNFEINVVRSPIDADSIASTDSFSALATALVDVQNLITDFAAGAEALENAYAPRLTGVEQNLKREKIRPIVSFLADDSPLEDYDKLKPISVATGAPFSIAVIAKPGRALFGDMTKLRELIDVYGWETLSHTVNHVYLGQEDYATQDYEMRVSKENMEAAGLEAKGIVYPYGNWNADTLEIAAKYYDYGYMAGTNMINDSPISSYKIDRVQFDPTMGANNTLAYYKSRVDEAVAGKKWVIFMLHSKVSAFGYDDWLDATQQQMLVDLINYIKGINVDIMTCGDALKVFKNVYETKDGTFAIGAKTTAAHTVLSGRSDITASALIGVFPRGESLKVFAANSGEAFPASAGGVLRTVSYGAIEQSYQEWKPYNKNRVYMRKVAFNGTWEAWVQQGDHRILSDELAVTPDTLLANFPNGESLNVFALGNGFVWPESQAGSLRTIKFGGVEQSYQEWKPYNSRRIYMRLAQSNGMWGSWVQQGDYRILTDDIIVGAATLIAGFPVGESIKVFTVGQGESFPISPGGILRTVSFGNVEQSYQEWTPYNSSGIYWRKVKSDGTWDAWLRRAADYGTSANRPTNAHVGYLYFDTTLGKPIWLKTAPSTWVDASGTTI